MPQVAAQQQRNFVSLAPAYTQMKRVPAQDSSYVIDLFPNRQSKASEVEQLESTSPVRDIEKWVKRMADTHDPLHAKEVYRIYSHLDRLKQRLASDPNNPRLQKMYAEHYKRSKDLLVHHNQRMVVRIANRYASKGLTFADLFQEGNIGLLKAIDRFEYKKGWAFSTYAVWWIKEGIDRATKNQSRLIRVPIGRLQKKVRVQKMYGIGFTELKTELDSKQIAEMTGLSHAEVLEMKMYDYEPTSLDKKVGLDGDATLGDRLADSSAVDPSDSAVLSDNQIRLIAKLDELLDKDDARLVKRRFGLGGQHERTDSQLADLEGVRDSDIKKRLKSILQFLQTKLDPTDFSFE